MREGMELPELPQKINDKEPNRGKEYEHLQTYERVKVDRMLRNADEKISILTYQLREALVQTDILTAQLEELTQGCEIIRGVALRYKERFEKAESELAALRHGGSGLIVEERSRQISAEGWSADHDDEHQSGELAMAAQAYISYAAT